MNVNSKKNCKHFRLQAFTNFQQSEVQNLQISMAPPKSTVIAWKFVKKDGYNLSCQLCGHNFTGTLTIVDHLLDISNGSGGGVEACTKITDEQKATV